MQVLKENISSLLKWFKLNFLGQSDYEETWFSELLTEGELVWGLEHLGPPPAPWDKE